MKGCRPLTDEEIKRVLAKLSGRYAARNRALFVLGLKTGFRISEMLSLRIGDVSVTNGEPAAPPLPGFAEVAGSGKRAVDRITVQRRHMKGNLESRTIVLHPEAKAALEEWIAQLRGFGYTAAGTPLFLSQIRRSGKSGKARSSRERAISRIQAHRILHAAYQACGVRTQTGTHCMRKTFANKVYDALDKSLLKTQKALGHRSIASTVLYLSFREEEIDDAILSG